MTILTHQDINDYCARLNIYREDLTEFVVPDGVTQIGSVAFASCHSLTSITFTDGVTAIGNRAFYDCTSLTSIIIPDGVTTIDGHAFDRCRSLTSIVIPDGVTKIDDYAFHDCESVRYITIPDSAINIDTDAFRECPLTHIICNSPNLLDDLNIQNKDEIQFISTTDYFNNNYQDLLEDFKHSGFNSNHLSSKELNLIIKLDQKEYHPKWETIAEVFKHRSVSQIKVILHFFGKTKSMPEFFDTVSLGSNNVKHIYLNRLSLFLTPEEQKNLSNSTKDATIKPQKNQSD